MKYNFTEMYNSNLVLMRKKKKKKQKKTDLHVQFEFMKLG